MTIILNGTTGITTPALDSDGNLEYSGTLTGSTGVINIGSGQVYKDASGNVGIGTSSPNERLALGDGQSIALNAGSGGETTLVRWYYSGGVQSWIGRSNSDGAFVFGNQGSERARIDSSGNLLLGTTTANAAGGLTLSEPDATGCQSYFSGTTTGFHWRFGSGTYGVVGSISSSSTATTYSTSSDYRLKENIQPMTGALATVAQLNPVTYTWKADGSAGQGFIAHELQAVVPDCVTGEKDAVDAEGKPQYQGVDTSFLVATLVSAIQEQQTLITDLTARLEALEAL